MAAKDTMMKLLMRALSQGALGAVGIFNVELTESLPNDLPANTLAIDKAWRMMDGRIFHLEYQSTRETTLHRFLEYDARLAHAYSTTIRTVVLYHEAIPSAPSTLDIGTAQYAVENVFLNTLDGDEALRTVAAHLQAGLWNTKDRLRLALALNMHVDQMSTALEQVASLISQVPDPDERDLVVSAVLVLGEKGLTEAQQIWLRKELRQVSKMVEELMKEGREEGRQEGRQEGREEGERRRAVAIARKLLARGESVEKVADLTELPLADVQQLQTR